MSHHHFYGWRADQPDQRDHLYVAPLTTALPPSVDLRAQCPPVYDQGQLGSCTANAIAGALEFDQIKQGQATHWTPSRLFVYYNERVIEHTVSSDSGAAIRDGIKTVNKQGACNETLWSYDIAKFAVKPSVSCYLEAAKHQAVSYQRIPQALAQMQACLASGYPFVFGFSVYESFESAEIARTGVVPMPAKSEQMIGGHAVVCCGYDDNSERFVIRNSWGSAWGDQGHCTMPYQYLLNRGLASDFWTIRSVA